MKCFLGPSPVKRVLSECGPKPVQRKMPYPHNGAYYEMAQRDFRSARRLVRGRSSQFVLLEWWRGKDLTSHKEARPCQVRL
jgi:hypothetical protein